MKSLWSFWVPLLVIWIATREEIFAIKIPGSVSGSTSSSASTEPSTNAYEALRLGTSAGPGFLYRFWTPSREVRAIVDQAVDITVLRFQEGGIKVSERLMHMMIAHVVSAFCNYIFLSVYGGVLITMTGTYHIVGLHICITSVLCCINFLSLLAFSLVRYKYLFKVPRQSMILVVVVAMVPPTVSGMICLILHLLATTHIQINVLGSMAVICTILMYLMRYVTLVGYTRWALVVAVVGIVNSLLWIVHFDHDSKLPYKIASIISTVGRVVELIILLYYSHQYRHVLPDIESQLLFDSDKKSGDNGGGGDHANENRNACRPPLLSLHEKMNYNSDDQLLGLANPRRCEMDARDGTLGARDSTITPSHVSSTKSSPTVGVLHKSLKIGKDKATDDHGGSVVNEGFDDEMIKSSDMSLEDNSDVKEQANEDRRNAPSAPTSHEIANKHNSGGSFRLANLPRSGMDAPYSTLGAKDCTFVPSQVSSSTSSPTVRAVHKSLKIGREEVTDDHDLSLPKQGSVVNESFDDEMIKSSDMSLVDTSDVKDQANEGSISAPSPPATSHEIANKQNNGGSFGLDDLPRSGMDAPDSSAGNFDLVPSHKLAAASPTATSPAVGTRQKPLKIGKELVAEEYIPSPPKDGPMLNESIAEETTESSKGQL